MTIGELKKAIESIPEDLLVVFDYASFRGADVAASAHGLPGVQGAARWSA